jgi:hypothetical protein
MAAARGASSASCPTARGPRGAAAPRAALLSDQLAVPAQGWGENDRGVSYTFGPDCVTDFLAKHDLDLVCRAHQVRAGARPRLALGRQQGSHDRGQCRCSSLHLHAGGAPDS